MRNRISTIALLSGLFLLGPAAFPCRQAEATPDRATRTSDTSSIREGRRERLRRLEETRVRGGWTWALPTDHYDLFSNAPQEETRLYGRVLEAMFAAYQRIFRFRGEIERPLVVHIYENDVQFQGATGSGPGVGGFYDHTQIVTFFDHNLFPYDTVKTLLHEGTHQFEDLVLPDMSGITLQNGCWLIEGLATYFETAEVDGGTLDTGAVNYDRLRHLKQCIQTGDYIPLADLVRTPQPQFGVAQYEHAWGLIHFLLHADGGRLRPRFLDLWERVQNGGDAAEALALAFPDHTMDEVETAWKAYILAIR